MVDLPEDSPRPSIAERHLGLIAAIAASLGMIAICGSPAAVLAYAQDLAGAVWSFCAAIIG